MLADSWRSLSMDYVKFVLSHPCANSAHGWGTQFRRTVEKSQLQILQLPVTPFRVAQDDSWVIERRVFQYVQESAKRKSHELSR